MFLQVNRKNKTFLKQKKTRHSCSGLLVLAAQELLVPLLVCALFLGCTVAFVKTELVLLTKQNSSPNHG